MIALGLVLVVAAGILFAIGAPGPTVFPLAFLGLALSLGTVFERRYKTPRIGLPGAGWSDTGERFIDPETGRQVAVFSSPTGERDYRSSPGPR